MKPYLNLSDLKLMKTLPRKKKKKMFGVRGRRKKILSISRLAAQAWDLAFKANCIPAKIAEIEFKDYSGVRCFTQE